jgi:leader peptidase (prepilin peptidase) / N-methyltransferase
VRLALFAVAGALVGSLLTVVVDRVRGGERGARPCCGRRVTAGSVLMGLTTAGLFVASAAVHEDPFVAALVALFLAVMLVLGIIDARWRIIPDRIVYPSLAVGFAAVVIGQVAGRGVSVSDGMIGLAAYAGPLFLVALAFPEGMGFGDVTLAALIGLVLGSLGLSYVAVAAGVGIVAGGLGAILGLTVMKLGRKQQVPFGPFLAGGAAVAALAGPQIASLYLSILGG